MKEKMPCYVTRVDTYLVEDKIRPYGGELHISSEKQEKEIILQLLGGTDKSKENKDT